jgi:hypothetical protein
VQQLQRCKRQSDVRYRLGKLPHNLVTAYQEIIDDMDDHEYAVFEKVAQWVMVAQEPLSTEILVDALAQDPLHPNATMAEGLTSDILLDYCHNLIVFESSRSVWAPSHLSVIEFLEDILQLKQNADFLVSMVTLNVIQDEERRAKMWAIAQ